MSQFKQKQDNKKARNKKMFDDDMSKRASERERAKEKINHKKIQHFRMNHFFTFLLILNYHKRNERMKHPAMTPFILPYSCFFSLIPKI